MFAKLIAVILAVAIVACSLLAMRQARLQVASELARAQMRIVEQDHKLLKVRSQVAERIRPEAVHTLAANLGPLRPVITGERDELAEAFAKLNEVKQPEVGPQPGPQPGVQRESPKVASKSGAKSGEKSGSKAASSKAVAEKTKKTGNTQPEIKKTSTKSGASKSNGKAPAKPSNKQSATQSGKPASKKVADSQSTRGSNR